MHILMYVVYTFPVASGRPHISAAVAMKPLTLLTTPARTYVLYVLVAVARTLSALEETMKKLYTSNIYCSGMKACDGGRNFANTFVCVHHGCCKFVHKLS